MSFDWGRWRHRWRPSIWESWRWFPHFNNDTYVSYVLDIANEIRTESPPKSLLPIHLKALHPRVSKKSVYFRTTRYGYGVLIFLLFRYLVLFYLLVFQTEFWPTLSKSSDCRPCNPSCYRQSLESSIQLLGITTRSLEYAWDNVRPSRNRSHQQFKQGTGPQIERVPR